MEHDQMTSFLVWMPWELLVLHAHESISALLPLWQGKIFFVFAQHWQLLGFLRYRSLVQIILHAFPQICLQQLRAQICNLRFYLSLKDHFPLLESVGKNESPFEY